jgi:hypothetical protein
MENEELKKTLLILEGAESQILHNISPKLITFSLVDLLSEMLMVFIVETVSDRWTVTV